MLYSKYGHGDTLVILSMLYLWADLRHNFHVDHMFPKSEFTAKKLKAKGIPEDVRLHNKNIHNKNEEANK